MPFGSYISPHSFRDGTCKESSESKTDEEETRCHRLDDLRDAKVCSGLRNGDAVHGRGETDDESNESDAHCAGEAFGQGPVAMELLATSRQGKDSPQNNFVGVAE